MCYFNELEQTFVEFLDANFILDFVRPAVQ